MPDTQDTPDGQTHDESEPLDLEAIKERCEKATPGRWVARRFGGFAPAGTAYWYIYQPGREGEPLDRDDAQFISHARTDLPACVAELERVYRERAELRARVKELEAKAAIELRCKTIIIDAVKGGRID